MPEPLIALQSARPLHRKPPGKHTEIFTLFSAPTALSPLPRKPRCPKALTSTRRHDSCSSGPCVPISVITTAMETIRTSGAGTAGHATNPVLPAPRFLSHGGKQYGSGVVDYINYTLAGRSAHLGLSPVRLLSLGHCRGGADYPHRAAPRWPNMKSAVIQSRGASCHATPTRTAHLWIQSSVLAMVLSVALTAPARAVTLHAWSTASAPADHQSQYSGVLLTQSVAPLGAPPTE
jgi:hypothetical protein